MNVCWLFLPYRIQLSLVHFVVERSARRAGVTGRPNVVIPKTILVILAPEVKFNVVSRVETRIQCVLLCRLYHFLVSVHCSSRVGCDGAIKSRPNTTRAFLPSFVSLLWLSSQICLHLWVVESFVPECTFTRRCPVGFHLPTECTHVSQKSVPREDSTQR